MPAIAVAPTGLDNNLDPQCQYDLDPLMLTPFNVIGNWRMTLDPAYALGYYFANGQGGPANNGDSIEYHFAMVAGIYSFKLWSPRNSDCGMVDITMNGYTLLAGLDLYDPALSPASVIVVPQVAPADGVQALRFTLNNKNPASTGYFCRMHYFQFVPFQPGVL